MKQKMQSSDHVNNFLKSIVPGNYWLTKSMEFTHITTSGTLWYLKKFLVFYYFLFFTKKFETISGISEICEIFDNFISSLPENVQNQAHAFFYLNGPNIKVESFKNFHTFCTRDAPFQSEVEQSLYIKEAKKYYFAYLMNFGGQAAHKKRMKEILQTSLNYSNFLVDVEMYFKSQNLTDKKRIELLNDFPAANRNIRQVFFYYGFFHGNYVANMEGFYKFTPIGKAVISSNFHELVIIWEHQKLKMVSQSPVVKINNLATAATFDEQERKALLSNFDTHNHPYVFFLKTLLKTKVSKDAYQFILSRANNSHSVDDIVELIDCELEQIKDATFKILEKYERKGDLNSEDFEKERKKYVLGVQDLPFDQSENYYSFLDKEGISVLDKEKGALIVNTYDRIARYLDDSEKYNYKIFKDSLKNDYAKSISLTSDPNMATPGVVEFEWYKYIINFDKIVISVLVYLSIKLRAEKLSDQLSEQDIRKYFLSYKKIIASVVGITREKDFVALIGVVQNSLESQADDYRFGILSKELFEETIESSVDKNHVMNEISIEKLDEISIDNNKRNEFARTRDVRIIAAMKSYYIQKFSDHDQLIPCDVCSNKTFLNKNRQPYLEYHHIIPFNEANGPDHYLNLAGICPLCHRKFHYLNQTEIVNHYKKFDENNHMSIDLMQRIDKLYDQNVLEPIHLQYLFKEGAINVDQMNEILNRDIVIAE